MSALYVERERDVGDLRARVSDAKISSTVDIEFHSGRSGRGPHNTQPKLLYR